MAFVAVLLSRRKDLLLLHETEGANAGSGAGSAVELDALSAASLERSGVQQEILQAAINKAAVCNDMPNLDDIWPAFSLLSVNSESLSRKSSMNF